MSYDFVTTQIEEKTITVLFGMCYKGLHSLRAWLSEPDDQILTFPFI